MRGRYRFLVLAVLGLAALAGLIAGAPGGKRDLSYYVWYPGQAVSLLVTPQISEAGRLNTYAQLPVAFFVNVLFYASLGLGAVQTVRKMVEKVAKKLGGGSEAGGQDGL